MNDEENEDGDRLPPGKPFYMKVGVWNADGSMSTQAEGMFADRDIQKVIEHCMAETTEHGTENYVYECRAVRRIVQPDVKVITIGAKK